MKMKMKTVSCVLRRCLFCISTRVCHCVAPRVPVVGQPAVVSGVRHDVCDPAARVMTHRITVTSEIFNLIFSVPPSPAPETGMTVTLELTTNSLYLNLSIQVVYFFEPTDSHYY